MAAPLVFGALGALDAPTTGAASVSSLQAEATQIEHQLNVEQSQVAIDQERYFTVSEKVWQDEQQVVAVQGQVSAVQARTQSDVQHLRQVAINVYVHNGSGSDAVAALFSGTADAQEARTVYQRLAAGDLNTAIDQLQTDRQLLQAQEAALQRVTAEDDADRQTAAGILGQAETTSAQLAQLNASVNGQLAVAIAQERAAQAAAAAAAVQRQAAAQVTFTGATTAAPTTGDPGIGAWQRVAICEEGGQNDATYGYFGITPQSWAAYGGTQYSGTAGGASQAEQVVVANRISGGAVPDANGCASW